MFEFAEGNKVWWPVIISMPADGGPKQVEIEIFYSILTKQGAKKIISLPANEQGEATLDHIHGWKEFFDVHGKEIPFTRENLIAVMEFNFVEEAITLGWREASRGAATKNY